LLVIKGLRNQPLKSRHGQPFRRQLGHC
jgi:hypothetical protein